MTITAPAPGPSTDPAPEPSSARPHWRRHRFADPKPPPRDKWHRQRHEDEFVALAEAQRISPAASWMHQVAIARTNPQLSDLQTTTLKDLAAAIGRSISSVTRYRRELKDAGVEEHEHRCVRNADGTILGLPNKIRFTLPPDAQARLDARTQTAELGRHTKGRPTPKAPQNQPQPQPGAGRRPPAPEPTPGPQHRSFDDFKFCPTCAGERLLALAVAGSVALAAAVQILGGIGFAFDQQSPADRESRSPTVSASPWPWRSWSTRWFCSATTVTSGTPTQAGCWCRL